MARNRTGHNGPGTELDTETGTVFPETERGTGTVGTVFQEPKPEPSLSVKTVLKQKSPFQRGTAGTETGTLEPSHARTVAEPNRGHPERICYGTS